MQRCLVASETVARMSDALAELRRAHVEVAVVAAPLPALARTVEWRPHILIAEGHRTVGSEVALVRAVRTRSQIPILVVTRGADVARRIDLIRAGADDILPLPISSRELVVRVLGAFARLERARAIASDRSGGLRVGLIELDSDGRDVISAGRRVHMTRTEFAVMRHLMLHEDQVVRRSDLLDAVWGEAAMPGSNVVDRQIRTIRRKLEPETAHYIKTVQGVGYRLRSDRIGDTLRFLELDRTG